MKNRRYNIKDELAYFNKVTQNMDCKEKIKQSEIEKNEISIEEQSICNDFIDNFDLDKELANRNLLGWIDMIENQKLHDAVKSLSLDEQVLLSYVFEKEKTQRELEKLYNLDHSVLCRRYNKIINSLKKIIKTNDF